MPHTANITENTLAVDPLAGIARERLPRMWQ